MNEFLKNLRNNVKENGRSERGNRRNFSNPQYRNGAGEGSGRKFNRPQEGEKTPGLTSDLPLDLKIVLETIAENQGRLVEVQQRRVEVEDRKASALEELARIFADMITADPPRPAAPTIEAIGIDLSGNNPAAEAVRAKIASRSGSRSNREAIVNTIFSMRDNGATYNEIAEFLDASNVPTFSGKGKWHAQTIHRVCQTRK